MPANTGGAQFTQLALTVNTYSSEKGKGFPPERKSKMTQEIQFHLSHGKYYLFLSSEESPSRSAEELRTLSEKSSVKEG